MKSQRKFSKEFKQEAVSRLKAGQSVAEVARALEVYIVVPGTGRILLDIRILHLRDTLDLVTTIEQPYEYSAEGRP